MSIKQPAPNKLPITQDKEISRKMHFSILVLAGIICGMGWICVAKMAEHASAPIAVAHRFIFAALFMFPTLLFIKKVKPSIKLHLYCLLQGAMIYTIYSILSAMAVLYIISGIVAMIMTLTFPCISTLERIIFNKKIHFNVIIGGILATTGIIILIYDDVFNGAAFNANNEKIVGLVSALTGVIFFSLGSIVTKNQSFRDVPTLYVSIYSMLYGGILALLWGAMTVDDIAQSFINPLLEHRQYLYATVFIAFIQTPIVYNGYHFLIKNIGASEASFIFIIAPVVSVIISSLVEGLTLDFTTICAACCVLIGTVLTIVKPKSK